MRKTIDERLECGYKVDPETGCWVWQKALGRGGYGRIWYNGVTRYAHRVMYERRIGPVPEGLQLDHLCRNAACCNPVHLEPVTCRENLLRGNTLQAENAAKTHCKHGHELTPENTYTPPRRPGRYCRTCRREQAQALARKARQN